MGFFDVFKKKQVAPVQESQPEEPVEEPETTMEEDLLSSIKQFRKQQSSVREKFYEENNQKLAPAREKIERAEKCKLTNSNREKQKNIVPSQLIKPL